MANYTTLTELNELMVRIAEMGFEIPSGYDPVHFVDEFSVIADLVNDPLSERKIPEVMINNIGGSAMLEAWFQMYEMTDKAYESLYDVLKECEGDVNTFYGIISDTHGNSIQLFKRYQEQITQWARLTVLKHSYEHFLSDYMVDMKPSCREARVKAVAGSIYGSTLTVAYISRYIASVADKVPPTIRYNQVTGDMEATYIIPKNVAYQATFGAAVPTPLTR